MAQSILYINMYIPVTGMVGAKHGSHIRLFKEITDFFFTTNKMSTFTVFRKVRTMLASKLPAAHHVGTRA